jgi:hypothetical protein
VWHHTKHITTGITNTGNIANGAIGVRLWRDLSMLVAITIYYLVIGFQFIKRCFIGMISSFAMRNGYF